MLKFDRFCMETAIAASKMSYCERAKVGAVIAKNRKIISIGYNGTLHGAENCCEKGGKTHEGVIHAEANAILKMTLTTDTCEGATLYCTMAPCIECAKLILLAKISRVCYNDVYRDDSGIQLLIEHGVRVERICYEQEKGILYRQG